MGDAAGSLVGGSGPKARARFLALGGGDEIGGSCYLLQMGGKNLLIDAGLRLRPDGCVDFPDLGLLTRAGLKGPEDLDAVFLTHAHR